MKRGLIISAVLLVTTIVVVLLWRTDRLERIIDRGTPRENYLAALERAGLTATALVLDWKEAGERALREPATATLPLVNEVRHSPAAPRAFGYRFELRRGRLLHVAITVQAEETATVFVELFDAADLTDPLAVARREALALEYEIRKDGAYILRIQPELLRGGEMTIGQRTTASLTFPVSGRTSAAVRSFFRDPRDGGARQHHGIDIFAPRDTPVVAAAGGIATYVGTNDLGGNVVWVWNPARGQSHYYAHLSRQAVAAGSRVEEGQIVGYVGNTGNARTTPPHLHFGIYSRGEGPLDPLPFVRE
jgi:murein DD-endopeptidase MepM/ murein hydrolase activator NlpD